MRALLLVLACLSAPGDDRTAYRPTDFGPRDDAPPSSVRLLFSAPLDRSGWPTTLPAGFPTPTIIWLSSDPTHNTANPAQTFALTGAVETGGAPFCPGGDFGGVEENDGRCMSYRRLDGANDYYQGESDFGDWAGQPFTVLVLGRESPAIAGAGILASKRNTPGTNADGWALYVSGSATDTCNFVVDGASGSVEAASALPRTSPGSWFLCGGTIGASNVYAYMNTTAGGAQATPTAPADVSAGLQLGAQQTSHATKFKGDLAAVWIWEGTALSAVQVKTFTQAVWGLLEARGSTAAFANVGPQCCWVDGKIECYSDNFPILGCQPPAGVTGAPGPAAGGGYSTALSVTNKVVNSGSFTASWLHAYNPGVPWACSQADTPFRDGRTTCLVTDASDTAPGYVYQLYSGQTLVAGQTWTACFYAKASVGTSLDALFREETGASCTAGNYDKVALVSDGTWKQYQFTHTIQDGDCTGLRLYLSPYDNILNVTGQGAAFITGVQLFANQAWCPSQYCSTADTARACGGDQLTYALTSPVVSATGAIVGTNRWSVDWTPLGPNPTASGWIMTEFGPGDNSWLLLVASNFGWYPTPGAAYDILVPAVWTVGATQSLELLLNYGSDSYILRQGGVVIGSSVVARNSPTGITTLELGSASGSLQVARGADIKNVKLFR